jgi:outer membrane receptor for ferrienterochelin and colicins
MVEQRARFDEPEPDFGSLDLFRTPRRYGSATLTWVEPRVGELFVGLRVTGSMRAPHYAGFIDEDRLERTPVFATLDASVARALVSDGARRLVLTVTGRNLTGSFQRDLDRGPLRDAGYVYGPRVPRAVAVGLRVEL